MEEIRPASRQFCPWQHRKHLPIGLILVLCDEIEHGWLVLLYVIRMLLIVGRIAHLVGLAGAAATLAGRAGGDELVAIRLAALALLDLRHGRRTMRHICH